MRTWLLALLPSPAAASGCCPRDPTPSTDDGTVPTETHTVGGDDDDDDDGNTSTTWTTSTSTTSTSTTSTSTSTSTPTTSTSTSTTSTPLATSIYDLQAGLVPDGTEVVVSDVVVTGVAADGFFVQERAGGPASGIWVYGGAGFTASPGDRVELEGVFDDSGAASTIDLPHAASPGVHPLGTTSAPTPALVSLADLRGASGESWEGVLVTVEDAVITVPDAGNGAFEIGDGGDTLRIGGKLHTWSSLGELPADATVLAVTGVVDQVGAAYVLDPRDDDDVEVAAVDAAALNQGGIPLGTPVEIFDLVVNGPAFDGVFAQSEAGGPFSGVWLYLGNDWELTWGNLVPGDRIGVWAELNEYNGLTELDLVGAAAPELVVLGSGPAPTPQVVAVADATEAWEGVLVTVQDVIVADPDLGYGEWSLTPRVGGAGTVVVDDKIHTWSGAATLSAGDRFDAVTGPLSYSYGAYKIEPRDEGDVVAH
ncbi:MAG: hypothetical protein R3F59_04915 [Myxococcota bacterium]